VGNHSIDVVLLNGEHGHRISLSIFSTSSSQPVV
jgi:hypothetical protein